MKLTSKGRYAVTAILDIAIHANDGPVSLSDISERQNISLSYLEQLFAKLRRNHLVKSVRGPGGGYKLGYAPDEISIGMIIAAVNEKVIAKMEANVLHTNYGTNLANALPISSMKLLWRNWFLNIKRNKMFVIINTRILKIYS